jgi:hypothetical protein
MNEVFHYPGEMVWQELREFPGKGKVSVLRDEGKGGAKTVIVRLPAGGQIVPHSHVGAVQHYVLEGEGETQGRLWKKAPIGSCRNTWMSRRSSRRKASRFS